MKNIKKFICMILVLATLATLAIPFSPRASAASTTAKYLPRYTGSSGSLVTALKAVSVDSSYSYRARIAAKNNINSYKGTAKQNTCMLNYLKAGTLLNPDYTGPASTSNNSSFTNSYYDRYTGKSSSVVDALNSLSINSSYSFRCKIAKSNSIDEYRGTAEQNKKMLDLLKAGLLINPDANTPHVHSMKTVAGSSKEKVRVLYCSCGYYEAKKQGVVQQSTAYALPNNGYVVSPEEIALALGAMKGILSAAGAATSSVLVSVGSVMIPVVIFGVIVYAFYDCTTKTATLVDVKYMSQYDSSKIKKGEYYPCGLFTQSDGNKYVLFYYGYRMKKAAAQEYLINISAGEAMSVIDSKVELASVYTSDINDAWSLAKGLERTGLFKFGASTQLYKVEKNSNLRPDVLYFKHFHLFDSYSLSQHLNPSRKNFLNAKVRECHIFFDPPFSLSTT